MACERCLFLCSGYSWTLSGQKKKKKKALLYFVVSFTFIGLFNIRLPRYGALFIVRFCCCWVFLKEKNAAVS